jgi:aryl-phospho-beta-D-glucosidase BglC (GH1 family)
MVWAMVTKTVNDKGIGQDAANKVFKKHWQTWITQDDIDKSSHMG